MSSGITCPNCGRINRPGAKMCANCGKPLPVASSQPPQSAQPQTPRPQPQMVPPAQRPGAAQTPRPVTPSVVQPASRRYQFQPIHLAVIAAAVVGIALCIALGLLFGQRMNVFGAGGSPTRTTEISPTLPITTTITATAQALATETAPIPTATPLLPTTSPSPIIQTVVAVVTATPPPPPSPTPTLTAEPPTPIPVTPVPTRTRVPPTATPQPTATLPADTPAGSILATGQTWYQNKMAMTIGTPKLSPPCNEAMIEFPFTLQNNDTTDVGLSLNGSAFVFTDDQTQGYELYYVNGTSPDACDKYTKLVDYHLNALGAQKNVELSIQARGQLP